MKERVLAPMPPADPINAAELLAELRRLRARIPHYTQLTARQSRSMVRVAYLDPEFLDTGIAAVDAYPDSEPVLGRNSEDLRQIQKEIPEWTAIEEELSAMTSGVSAANLQRRYILGRTVLQIYGILRQLVREPEHASLLPWVDALRRTNRFGHKRKKAEG